MPFSRKARTPRRPPGAGAKSPRKCAVLADFQRVPRTHSRSLNRDVFFFCKNAFYCCELYNKKDVKSCTGLREAVPFCTGCRRLKEWKLVAQELVHTICPKKLRWQSTHQANFAAGEKNSKAASCGLAVLLPRRGLEPPSPCGH